ncbi:MAG: glycosyltransferase family 4 protein [Patescibacteria group bacterium]|nr:glycosyltransferase family 4 protein [Patescibacteria group bacterium]
MNKIKVAFCSSPLKSGHKTRGIGFYTKYLLEVLKKEDFDLQEFSDIREVKDADIVHYPFFDLFAHTLPFVKKIPTIVTIHDVIPLAFPENYPPGVKGSANLFLQKLSLKNIAAVITDSDDAKKDIVRYLGVSADKICPIPLAPASHFHQIKDRNSLNKVKDKYRLPEVFALFTGSVNYNKNLLSLTEGAIKSGIDIVLVGKSFETRENLDHPELKSFAEFLKRYEANPKVHILGFVEDEDLVAITNLAKMLLLPSFKEGFGMPILEAQVCGIPVITSKISSMPEVAGERALLVDPYNVEDISQAIKSVVSDKKLSTSLIEQGFENIKKFSWEKAAKETIEVYKKVLENEK